MGSNSAGGGIAALGVLLAFVGVVLYVYEETETSWFGIVSVTTNPYRDIGTMLLVLGIIIVVVGVIVAAIPGRSSSPPPQQIGEYHQQPIAQTSHSPDMKFCRNCGVQVQTDSAFCDKCGKKL